MANGNEQQADADLSLHIFSMSAGLVGVCLTGIGLFQIFGGEKRVVVAGDELMSIDALLFLVACVLCFWSFKTQDQKFRRRLRQVVDAVFILGLCLMVAVCALIAYAIL